MLLGLCLFVVCLVMLSLGAFPLDVDGSAAVFDGDGGVCRFGLLGFGPVCAAGVAFLALRSLCILVPLV